MGCGFCSPDGAFALAPLAPNTALVRIVGCGVVGNRLRQHSTRMWWPFCLRCVAAAVSCGLCSRPRIIRWGLCFTVGQRLHPESRSVVSQGKRNVIAPAHNHSRLALVDLCWQFLWLLFARSDGVRVVKFSYPRKSHESQCGSVGSTIEVATWTKSNAKGNVVRSLCAGNRIQSWMPPHGSARPSFRHSI